MEKDEVTIPNTFTFLALVNFLIILTIAWFIPVIGPFEYVVVIFFYFIIYILVLNQLRKSKAHYSLQAEFPELSLVKKSHDLIQHWLLPLIELLSFAVLLYSIDLPGLHLALCAIQGFIFWVLGRNITYYFHKNNQEEIHTHYIYDLLTIVTIFFLAYASYSLLSYFAIPLWIGSVLNLVFILLISVISADRYNFHNIRKLVTVIFTSAAILILLFSLASFSIIKISFLFAFLEYLNLNYLHHFAKNERVLKVALLEYCLLIAIVLLVLWQIRV